jgi:cytochrome b
MSKENGVLVWDLPVRLLHWSAAGLFVVAFAVATLSDDEGTLFPLHALAGAMLMAVVVARLIWAFAGSQTARLSSFDLRPSALVAYLRASLGFEALAVRKLHNPATSWYALAALAVLTGLGVTGYLLGRGNGSVEDAHEVLAFAMLGLAGLHVAGILLHSLRTRENVVRRMLTGRGPGASPWGIPTSRWPVAALLALLAIGWAAALWTAYDPAHRTLAVGVGAPLVIGEGAEGHEPRP